MDLNKFLQNVIQDIKVDLSDEFDRNFERKAFFDKKWQQTRFQNRIGSLMMRKGNLRNSINAKVEGNKIVFTSSMPYANIHNNGGELTITDNMKKYFWAKHLEAKKAKAHAEAEQWKAMALKKVGSKITIPQRQFIGYHTRVKESVEKIVNKNIEELNNLIQENLKR